MEFTYQYKVRVSDLWQMYMYYAYSSYLKIISPVFTLVSLILLAVFWEKTGTIIHCFLLFLTIFFPVVQPAMVWGNSSRQLKKRAPQLELIFREGGIYITAGVERDRKKWSQVKHVLVKPTLIAIYIDNNVGYVLTNRVLGKTRKEFLEFLQEHLPESVIVE